MRKKDWGYKNGTNKILNLQNFRIQIGKNNWNLEIYRNGILLPKLFWPTVRKNCSSDRGKLLKFEAEGQEFAKSLRSLEQFI